MRRKKMVKRTPLILLAAFFIATGAYAADDLKSTFSEGIFEGRFRFFQFSRDYDDSIPKKDIASGGMLYYRTDPLYGIDAGLAFYTGQEMGVNDTDKKVYGLLAADANGDHESFSVLGEAFIQGRFKAIAIKAGRQELETPFVNTDDNRLTPQSTESYSLTFTGIPKLEVITAYVSKMRGKAESEFISMTEYAGVDDSGTPVLIGGLVYDATDHLKLQIWDFHAENFLNEVYLRGDFSRELNAVWSWFGSGHTLPSRIRGIKTAAHSTRTPMVSRSVWKGTDLRPAPVIRESVMMKS